MTKMFIHIPKCGGMTIRKAPELTNKIRVCSKETLKDPYYVSDLLSTMKSIGDHHGIEHARYVDINENTKKTYKFFSVIRNPWGRTISRFLFAKKIIEQEKKHKYDYANISSFEAFLEERHIWGNKNFMWHRAVRGWYNCFDYVTDVNRNLACDIIRFENYNEDIVKYFNLKNTLKSRNITGYTNSYHNYYNPNTIQIVADWYKSDIDFFGYDFDTGPSKNFYFEDKNK
jgi:hypothetical protein